MLAPPVVEALDAATAMRAPHARVHPRSNSAARGHARERLPGRLRPRRSWASRTRPCDRRHRRKVESKAEARLTSASRSTCPAGETQRIEQRALPARWYHNRRCPRPGQGATASHDAVGDSTRSSVPSATHDAGNVLTRPPEDRRNEVRDVHVESRHTGSRCADSSRSCVRSSSAGDNLSTRTRVSHRSCIPPRRSSRATDGMRTQTFLSLLRFPHEKTWHVDERESCGGSLEAFPGSPVVCMACASRSRRENATCATAQANHRRDRAQEAWRETRAIHASRASRLLDDQPANANAYAVSERKRRRARQRWATDLRAHAAAGDRRSTRAADATSPLGRASGAG